MPKCPNKVSGFRQQDRGKFDWRLNIVGDRPQGAIYAYAICGTSRRCWRMILICMLLFNFVVAGSTSPSKGCATRGIFSKLVWQTRGQNRHLVRLATKCRSFSDPTTLHFPVVVVLLLSNQSLVWLGWRSNSFSWVTGCREWLEPWQVIACIGALSAVLADRQLDTLMRPAFAVQYYVAVQIQMHTHTRIITCNIQISIYI